MKHIALLGECMIELNGEPFASMQQTYGGDTLNTAVYLARITPANILNVQYFSALGTDKLSQGMLTRWLAEGVGTDLMLTDTKRQPGLYLIQLDAQGERTFLYWRNQSAARYMVQHPGFPGVLEKIAAYDALYLSGISLAILPEEDREILITALANLAKSGVKIIFDSNYRPALWQSAEQTRECYQQLFPHLSLAFVTFADEKALWDDIDPAASIARLQAAGVKETVVKMGAEGAIYAQGTQQIHVSTEVIASIEDTTAAGDSFNAGFLAGYMQGKTPEESCTLGNRLAGIVIQHKGAIIPAGYCKI